MRAKKEKQKRNHRPGLGASIGRAADLLEVSRASVQALIEEGRLEAVEIGKRTRITLRSIDKLKNEMNQLGGQA